nr:uncharacterized protein LOC121126354 [Lepeophtheirus salmonis]
MGTFGFGVWLVYSAKYTSSKYNFVEEGGHISLPLEPEAFMTSVRKCRGIFVYENISKAFYKVLALTGKLLGFFVKFTSQFKQSWAVMIDIQGMNNPIIKDLAINSIGDVYALIAYESSSSGKKITAIAKYDSCGIFVSYVDVLEGTFVSRDAYISIDSQDNALIVNSNVASFSEHPCRIYSSRASSDFRPLWNVTIRREGVSCLPTGIVTDCEDHVYVSGFFGSDGGFVKKLNKSTGAAIWSLEDDLLQGQITDLVHDVASAEIIVVVNNAHLHRVKSSDGSILKSAEILVKKFTILPSGEILAFVFTLEDRSHRLVMLNYDLQTERVYSIPWNDWNSIAWCDNLVEDVDGRAVFLSCAMNPTHDIIIFRIEV